MLRIVTTFVLLSILGIALSGVAAFGASADGASRSSRWVSVDSVASFECVQGGETTAGYGLFEYWALGEHAPTGLTPLTDH